MLKAVHSLTKPLPGALPSLPQVSKLQAHPRAGLTPALFVWLCFVSSSGSSGTKGKELHEGPWPHKKLLNVAGPDGTVLG